MSSKTTKKATTSGPKVPEPIVTRTKSAQQRRQLRIKPKKTEKAILNTLEIKSPKLNKSEIRPKESLLKSPVKSTAEVIEQVEYYPNKLKRDISTKKIMLKPKHHFKVIAGTNKRKRATPQKGIKSPPPSKKQKAGRGMKSPKSRISRSCSSPQLSMQDMVRIMEESRSLSDEDFMEILTCPSPVWWEDPPDGRYDEDSIYTRSSEPPVKQYKETKKRKMKTNPINTHINISNCESITKEQSKITVNKKDEKFVKKKLKLENILGNIKNNIKKPDEIKNLDDIKDLKNNDVNRNRNVSESEGDISDMSFNEEEILKNLENMDIPVEGSVNNTNIDTKNIKTEIDDEVIKDEIVLKNENETDIEKVEMELLPQLKIKPEIKDEIPPKSSVFDIGPVPDTNIKSISDVNYGEMTSKTNKKSDEIVIVDSCCTNSRLVKKEDSNSILDSDTSSYSEIVNKSSNEQNNSNCKDANNTSGILPNKKIKDLSEYITVYKIIPEKNKIEKSLVKNTKPAESIKKTKLDTVRGKLNDFFKQCKNNKRLKKTETTIPAVPVTDVKESTDNEKENGDKTIDLEDEKNRLKSCDYCIEKTENGTTYFSCDKCEKAPILPCDLCNFLADTKELYRKHVSTCKEVARISWSHNLVLNQT